MFRVKNDTHTLSNCEMRNCFVKTLEALMKEDERIIVLEADLGGASGTLKLQKSHPKRFIQCGISEANMCGVAAGLSMEGFKPYIHSFAPFVTRRIMDQIYLSGAYGKNTIHIYGSDPGFSVGANGGTHTSFDDMAFMRTIPNAVVCEASDDVQLAWILNEFSKSNGIHYVRCTRKAVRRLYEENSTFQLGKGNILRHGCDVLIISMGELVADALDVADQLKKQKVSCEVIDMFTLKPLDISLIQREMKHKKLVVTFENHSIIGGLGSAIAEVIAEANINVKFLRHGVQDQFGQVGTPEFLKKEYQLNTDALLNNILTQLEE